MAVGRNFKTKNQREIQQLADLDSNTQTPMSGVPAGTAMGWELKQVKERRGEKGGDDQENHGEGEEDDDLMCCRGLCELGSHLAFSL